MHTSDLLLGLLPEKKAVQEFTPERLFFRSSAAVFKFMVS